MAVFTPGPGVTRGDFLSAAGALLSSYLVDFTELTTASAALTAGGRAGDAWLEAEGLAFDDTLTVVRPEDFLQLIIGLCNAEVRPARPVGFTANANDRDNFFTHDSTAVLDRGKARIVRLRPGAVTVVVILNPQHIAEMVYPKIAPPTALSALKPGLISRSSRIAYSIDEHLISDRHGEAFALSLDGLFELCNRSRLVIPKRTLVDYSPAAQAQIPMPLASETAIEYPTRLVIAPVTDEPVKLKRRVNNAPPADKNISKYRRKSRVNPIPPRAVIHGIDLTNGATRPFFAVKSTVANPFKRPDDVIDPIAPLDHTTSPVGRTCPKNEPTQLDEFLRQTVVSDSRSTDASLLLATVMEATALGINGAMSFKRGVSKGNPFTGFSIITVNGRDYSLELVFDGVLLPGGHRAQYVRTVYRQPVTIESTVVAPLLFVDTIRLIDKIVAYTNLADNNHRARAVAAAQIALSPHESPPILAPCDSPAVGTDTVLGGALPRAFLPMVAPPPGIPASPVTWSVAPTSLSGDSAQTPHPLLFMFNDAPGVPDAAYESVLKTFIERDVKPFYGKPVEVVTKSAPVKKYKGQTTVNPGDLLEFAANGASSLYFLVTGSRPVFLPDNPYDPDGFPAGLDVRAALSDMDFRGQLYTYVESKAVDAAALAKHRAENAVKALLHRYDFDLKIDPATLAFKIDPSLAWADVTLPSAEALGAIEDAVNRAKLTLTDEYVRDLDLYKDARAQIYARLESARVDFNRETSTLRSGIASMRQLPAALSTLHGTLVGTAGMINDIVRDPGKIAEAHLDQLFDASGLKTRILGIVDLSQLLKGLTGDLRLPDMPKLDVKRTAQGVTVRNRFMKELKPISGVIEPGPSASSDTIPMTFSTVATLDISGRSTRELDLNVGAFTVVLPPSNIDALQAFAGLVSLDFRGLDIEIRDGATAVRPHFVGARLKKDGPLAFLEFLGSFLGGQRPFSIDLSPISIAAIGHFGLPPVTLGAFTLQNLFFEFQARLPLDADLSPSLSFNLGTRRNPFTARVGILGGSGWFRLLFSAVENTAGDGVPALSFAGGINVSAGFDIDLGGIVHGEVAINAGVFFETGLNANGSYLRFGGGVVISGCVEAFGLISASMYVDIFALYDSGTGNLEGSAEYHVEVHMLFFSASFSTSVSFSKPLGSGNSTAAALNSSRGLGRTAWDDHVAWLQQFS